MTSPEEFTDSNLTKLRDMFNELSGYIDAPTAFTAVDDFLTEHGIAEEPIEQTARQIGSFVIPDSLPDNFGNPS